jgi:Uma2 family endonuclease
MTDATTIRMTIEEFRTLPESNRFEELIDGELIVSPTPKQPHQKQVFTAAKAIEQLADGGEVVIAPMDVYLNGDIVEPDIFWVSGVNSKCQLGDDGYWYGAPDLVVEVLSPSTAGNDRGKKYELYQRHGVREYWLIDTDAKFIEVFVLDGDKFVRRGLFSRGAFISDVLSGKTVDVKIVLAS